MSFKKIEETGQFPGPRAILVSGYNSDDHNNLNSFINGKGFENIEVVACKEGDLDLSLEEVLLSKRNKTLIEAEKLPKVILWSGISHKEFDLLLNDFANAKISRPIFATSTDTNLTFAVKELLQHLLSEQKAMRDANKK